MGVLEVTANCCEAQEIPLNNPCESAEDTWNNHNYRELRRALLHLEKPVAFLCWHNEESGIVSNLSSGKKTIKALRKVISGIMITQ